MNEAGRYYPNGGKDYKAYGGDCRNNNAPNTPGTAKVGSYLPNAWGLYQNPAMNEAGRYYPNGGKDYKAYGGDCRNNNAPNTPGTAKVGSYLPNAWGLYQAPAMNEAGRYYPNGGKDYKAYGGDCRNNNAPNTPGTAKVGSYLPNAWGLYDMHGNVLEWCLDWYGSYPGNAIDPAGAQPGSERVLRGGSWSSYAYFCRSASRNYYPPSCDNYDFGFRVVFVPAQ